MAYSVKFLKGTLEAYNGLATKDVNTFYYAGQDLFLGEIKLSNGADLAAAILRISTNESDIDKLQADIKALTGGETGSISGLIEEAVNAAKVELRKEIKANSDAIDAIEADYLKAADKTELANSIKAISDDYLKGSDKTELEGKIKTNTDAIAVLNGDDTVEGSVAKEVKDAINAFSTAMTDNGTYDTFAELVQYVETHGGQATEMAAAIGALETKVGEKSVQTQISEAFTTANLDQYATDGELSALTEIVNGKAAQSEVTTISGKVTTLEGKVDVAKVSEAITAAETYAKNYADGLAKDYDAAGSASTALTNATSYTDREIQKLDADVTSASVESGKGIQVQVVEVDGKITNVVVSGNYNNSYDAKGAAGTAKSEAISAAAEDATTKANTAESNAKAYVDGALTWGTIA